LLGARLAKRLGLPTTPVAVSEELIALTSELAMETPRSRIPCQPGPQFGSRYPGDPRRTALHDFLPDEQLREVWNLHDFAGMLVFDKWTCNTNGRQTVFFRRRSAGPTPLVPGRSPGVTTDAAGDSYETVMIDQGFCFNAGSSAQRLRISAEDSAALPSGFRVQQPVRAQVAVPPRHC